VNLLDIAIILLLVTALVRGMDVGFVRQACSTIGFFIGLFAGAWLQGKLIVVAHSPGTKALLSLAVMLVCIAAFVTAGEIIGGRLKHRLKGVRIADTFDRVLGSVIAGITMLLAIWICAAIFRPALPGGGQAQIAGSRIITSLNGVLPPAPKIIAGLGHLIDPNSFPQVFTGLEPRIRSDPPLPDLGELNAAVQKTWVSTVKVQGEGCGGIVDGSGFVAGDGLVVTNAHVVAGVAHPSIIDIGGKHDAKVIAFDPELDIAILRADGLRGDPLTLQTHVASDGTPAAALGYPGGGEFTAKPAVVLDSFQARGKDIYNQQDSTREVYSIKADIQNGNSGGPLIDAEGSVVGVVFARSTSYQNVGYALTIDQVINALRQAETQTRQVATGSCAQ